MENGWELAIRVDLACGFAAEQTFKLPGGKEGRDMPEGKKAARLRTFQTNDTVLFDFICEEGKVAVNRP